ncbi:Apl3p [Sugiyamaella lignohabitans]|uniref:AP-2 complex subunit alpha n=1 Tax=Sugiyamaella lignohabitans TaxID=796027 RepID=A0A167EQ74_9ASCO|nr:Apl3p [Sugiyamaella lignohabitans]ANB14334.1 Apl3p [Sugiyamaella lignohabitans]
MSQPMKGLVQFIADLRNARAREVEVKRVNAELANIRTKFRDPNLNGYNKKKYISKLIYMYILGYEIDIGHVESVSLLSSTKYSEKQIGYLAISLMLNENDSLLDMVVNSARKDLESLDEMHTCLALNCIATVGGRSIGDALSNDIFKLLISPTSPDFVRKKAALTMLRLYRKNPNIIMPGWADRIVALLDHEDLGVATSVVSLVIALVQDNPEDFKMSYGKAVRRLQALVFQKEYSPDYVYYEVPAPWLFIKLFRLLQYYPPTTDEAVEAAIRKVIFKVVDMNAVPVENIQQNNAQNAVLFEVINLAIHLEVDAILLDRIVDALGKFLKSSETNVRYLSLNAMAILAARYDTVPIRKHIPAVVKFLRDKDISIRRKAVDLLYCLCDGTNVITIVGELLKYLQSADFALREEMVIRIAILAEKYATEYQWYVDTSLRLIAIAGNHVSDEVWTRVIQIVVNNEGLQVYAARTVCSYLKQPNCNETMVKVGGYILGEYGHLIADDPGHSPIEQFLLLHDKFPNCSSFTRGILLTTYVKFVNLFVEIKPQLVQVFEFHSTSIDSELQQRACEYLRIVNSPNPTLLPTVWDEMPPFPERTSALLTRLHQKHVISEDKRVWALGNKQAQVERAALNLDQRGSANLLSTPPTGAHAVNGDQNGTAEFKGNGLVPAATGAAGRSGAPPPPPVPRKGSGSTATTGKTEPLLSSNWEEGYRNHLSSVSGIFYEDSLIQIGLKSEYRRHLGCVILYFKNISGTTLQSLSVDLSNPAGNDKLSIATKNFPESTIPHNGSTQQVIVIEAKQPFEESPLIKITYLAGTLKVLNLKLPVVIEKFMEPANLNADEYFKRWNQIGGAPREAQKVFKNISASSADGQLARTAEDDAKIVSGMHWSILRGVDKNPANFIGGSVLHTSAGGNFGCLLRLEPDNDKVMYRVTVRATNEALPSILAKNLTMAYQL